MKYAKMLGLAVLAALALTALLGAGSASATVLCKTDKIPCPKDGEGVSEDFVAGTEIVSALDGSVAISSTGGTVLGTCTESILKGKTENTGGEGESVKVKITEFTFGACTGEIVVVKMGRLTIEYIPVSNNTRATLLALETQMTVTVAGSDCIYGFAESGTVIGKGTGTTAVAAKFHIEKTQAVMSELEPKKFLCPDDATWGGEYTVLKPSFLYFKEKAA
jgi:hypothetical protein